MSTGAIIAIVVAVLIIIALLAFVLPRMRARARVRAREKELQERRERVAGEHRAEAETRQRQATEAEQKARIAQREAEAERAQADLHQERASLHERGRADYELIDDHERERFAGTSAMQPATDDAVDRDGRTGNGRAATVSGEGSLSGDYQRGRRDEAVDETAGERGRGTTR